MIDKNKNDMFWFKLLKCEDVLHYGESWWAGFSFFWHLQSKQSINPVKGQWINQ